MKKGLTERVTAHGERLRAIFGLPEQCPIALSKRFFRLESAASRAALQASNVGLTDDEAAKIEEAIMGRLAGIIGPAKIAEMGIFMNWDPRGYALKTSPEWARCGRLPCDMGGHGILAPDLR